MASPGQRRTIALVAALVELDSRRVLRRDGTEHRLSEREVQVLTRLVARQGAPITKLELQTEVWEHHPNVRSRAVDAAIARLRKKIERDPKDPDHILTAYGVGFRFAWAAPNLRADEAGRATTGFIGRDADLESLTARVVQGGGQWCLAGPPGVGKSRLAQELLQRLKGVLPERTFAVVDLAGRSSVDEVALSLARVLGLSTGASTRSLLDRVVAAIREAGPLLLVLEDVDRASPVGVAALAAGLGRRSTLICTARRPLGTPGEQVYRLSPLSTADAAELYLQGAERRGVQRASINRDAVDALVDQLGGLPLLIELAAARQTTLSARSLLELLKAEVSQPGEHAGEPSIQSAWGLLRAPEREAASSLAVFSGPFGLPAARAVVGGDHAVETLEALVDASWIQVSQAGHRRYRMLQPLRARAGHGSAKARSRLSRFMASQTRFVAEWTGVETVTLAQLMAWIPELETAVHHADEGAVDCLCALRVPLLELGQGRVLRELAEELSAAGSWGVEDHARLTLLAAIGAGSSSDGRGGLALWSTLNEGDLEGVLGAQWRVCGASLLRRVGEFKRAFALAQQAEVMLRDSQAVRLRARALWTSAILASYLGNDDRALQMAEGAVRAVLPFGPSRQLGYCRMYKGQILLRMNHAHRAEVCQRRALEMARETGASTLERAALGSLAASLREQRREDEAAALWSRALELNRAVGDPSACIVTHINMGNLEEGRGALEAARAHYAWAAELVADTGEPHRLGSIRLNLGAVLHRQGRVQAAMTHYRAARRAAQASGRRRMAGYVDTCIALAQLGLGDAEGAADTLSRTDTAGIGDAGLADILRIVRAVVGGASIEGARRELSALEGSAPRTISALLGGEGLSSGL
jgi:tetratricopeptide (TPR) repeat protein/DNA-binding winged helix-turn-helix (wHTH) protein